MLITFSSKAAASILMFGSVAEQLLHAIDRQPAPEGAITVEQLPETIAHLQQLIKTQAPRPAESSEETEPNTVTLGQRASPLLELCLAALKAQQPVIWQTT